MKPNNKCWFTGCSHKQSPWCPKHQKMWWASEEYAKWVAIRPPTAAGDMLIQHFIDREAMKAIAPKGVVYIVHVDVAFEYGNIYAVSTSLPKAKKSAEMAHKNHHEWEDISIEVWDTDDDYLFRKYEKVNGRWKTTYKS